VVLFYSYQNTPLCDHIYVVSIRELYRGLKRYPKAPRNSYI
jgi:hypothetical protein